MQDSPYIYLALRQTPAVVAYYQNLHPS